MIIKIGSNDLNTDGEVTRWQQWFKRFASSYAPPVDGYVGDADVAAIRILQGKLGIVIDGQFGDRTAAAVGYKWKGGSVTPVVPTRRPIWIYTAPGSGAPGNVGPSFQLGERCKRELNINHQWIGYPIGGYLGFMGGPPDLSYLEVIDMLDREFERLLDLNPDVQRAMTARRADPRARVDVELWVSGYSQSADGVRRSVKRLFSEGGKYYLIRDRINGIVNFGDPGTPGTGIARTVDPQWLNDLVTDINYANDFYAVAPDKIRPAMYGIIIQAEMELPFFVHVLRIAVPVIQKWASMVLPFVAPLLGGFGPLLQMGLGLIGGLNGLQSNPLLGQMIGQAGGTKDAQVDADLIALLEPMGLLANAGDLIGLVGALPGLQAHGGYEFDPAMMDRAWARIARPQRDAQGNRL